MSLRIEIIRPDELDDESLRLWTKLQYAAPGLDSPFFAPDFAKSVAEARSDAYIGLIYQDGALSGFFPFHRKPGKVGAPIGGPICDYQGVISASPDEMQADDLLKGCELDAFDFNHAMQSQRLFHRAATMFVSSPALDLKKGYEAYRQAVIDSGTNELKTAERKKRKLEREVGPLRFVPNDTQPKIWERLIDWKNISYAQMGVSSILDVPWARQTLESIRAKTSPDFSGMLSSLYAGDELAAVHFGMRSRNVWHWWFPTYGPRLEKYSPGVILLMEMAQWGAENGVTWLDLGRGESRYKTAFSTAAAGLCEGSIERSASLPGAARRFRKLCHFAAEKTTSERLVDFQRRAFNRLLGAGRL